MTASHLPMPARRLGVGAIWHIEVVDFAAFIVVDARGNDFFRQLNLE